MIFNSLVFLQFALVFFALWPLVRPHEKLRYPFLIIASCLFYGYGGWWFVPILLATATLDFWFAQQIYEKPEKKKTFLIASLVSNLSVLSLFKYVGFFAESINAVFGRPEMLPVIHLILPIGISFYTFQSLSYIFDVYKGEIKPARSIWHFLSIVTLFPHLVAGPIVRVAHILPQIEICPKATKAQIWDGIHLVVRGLFRKMVLADNLAPFVDKVYGGEFGSSGTMYVLATIAFSFQIYFDFSGYTDTARGLAKWLGLEFSLNFNHPYSAIGIRDFWSRWHISLSHWIRDYVYIPLGGSKNGELQTHRNNWISMIASGLWHGANWTFVVWGALHAFYISLERITRWPERLSKNPIGQFVGVLITFALATLGWVFFRANNIPEALQVLGTMATARPSELSMIKDIDSKALLALAVSVFLEGLYIVQRYYVKAMKLPWVLQSAGSAAMLLACIYLQGPGKAFIYFQF